MELGDDFASSNQQGNTAFYCSDGDGLGFRQVVSAGCQKAGNRSGRGNAVQRFRICLVGPLPSCCPVTDNAARTAIALFF
jgi:hypothetical protein